MQKHNEALKWEKLPLAVFRFVQYFSQLIIFPLMGRYMNLR